MTTAVGAMGYFHSLFVLFYLLAIYGTNIQNILCGLILSLIAISCSILGLQMQHFSHGKVKGKSSSALLTSFPILQVLCKPCRLFVKVYNGFKKSYSSKVISLFTQSCLNKH